MRPQTVFRLVLAAFALLSVGRSGLAQQPQIAFKDYRLPNGLRVLLAPDPAAPTVAVCVTYKVGSRDEHPGQAGWAHLMEHMMFQGSARVGRGEHRLLIEGTGGSFEADTSQDWTEYYETLPPNQLPLALFLEADRMDGLDLTQPNLDNQRAVVEAERSERHSQQVLMMRKVTPCRTANPAACLFLPGFTRFDSAHPRLTST